MYYTSFPVLCVSDFKFIAAYQSYKNLLIHDIMCFKKIIDQQPLLTL